jgi:hypothetical protein
VLRAEEGSMPVPEGSGHFPDLAPSNAEASPSRRRGGLVVTSGAPIQRSRRLTAFTTATLRTAGQAYCSNPVTAESTYGPITAWDTSAVEDMSFIFSKYDSNFNSGLLLENLRELRLCLLRL